MQELTERLVGKCSVDSGKVLIGDPCYFIADDFSEQDYEEVCKVTRDDDAGILRHAAGHEGKAVVSFTAHGDGVYPVYAIYRGKTIVGLRIDFDPRDEDDDWS